MLLADAPRRAVISDCGKYRYVLTRGPIGEGPPAIWGLANPSTADADIDDPTVRRVWGFTQRLGHRWFILVNPMAYRATKPEALLDIADPVGPENEAGVRWLAHKYPFATYVVGWGTAIKPPLLKHAFSFTNWLTAHGATLHCLGRTSAGQPRHPLMLAGDTPLEVFYVPK